MTREEAIEWIEKIKEKYIRGGDEEFDEKRKTALDMGIKALEQEPIPDNATNGEVIKAMFPNVSIHYHKANELVDDYVSVNIKDCDTQQDYSAEWWNAPYKAESEDKE